MTASLAPLDLHAHIEPSIATADVDALNAVVFCVTRSLDEAEAALQRDDKLAVWGVGCHPGLATALKLFSAGRFAELLERTCFAGELGLDGGRPNQQRQRATLRAALEVLQANSRITSFHSAGATAELLDELTEAPISGAVLHWWLGDARDTARAVELGCYFSVNQAGVNRDDVLSRIPLQRLLTETDHPFGDKRSRPHRPGNVEFVEAAVARHHGLSPLECRRQLWTNLATLVQETRCGRLVPSALRHRLATVPVNP